MSVDGGGRGGGRCGKKKDNINVTHNLIKVTGDEVTRILPFGPVRHTYFHLQEVPIYKQQEIPVTFFSGLTKGERAPIF